MSGTLRFVFIALLVLFFQKSAFAAIEPYKNFIKGQVKAGDSLFVKDEKFRNAAFNWSEISNISVQNAVTLQVIDEQTISRSFSCRVVFRVEYFSAPGQSEPSRIDSAALRVGYSKESGAVYQGTDTYRFTDGYLVKIYVISVSSPEYGSELPPVLQLTSQINIDRTYLFRPYLFMGINGEAVSPPGKGSAQRLSSGTPTNGNSQLALSWQLVSGAQEYDIEWSTIDSDSEYGQMASDLSSGAGFYTDAQIAELFRNNATRITTQGNNTLISLVYNSAFIAVRMRQVAYTADGLRNEGQWFYKKDDNNMYAVWPLSWHEQNLNWQYSAVYAEEGKKKEVVSYFDGTLRGRQTATLNSSDKVAVVQENIYDSFGRAAASILPAPVKESASGTEFLHYFSRFNRNANNVPYSFSDLNSQLCEPLPTPLSTQSGASMYYSPNNAFLSKAPYNTFGFTAYTPDASGYPLSVTQYTPDNTGRIRLQGGVGQIFQPGLNEKHTTRYFYDKPSQWELDRLFGNDVGYAEHYLKNTVVDPNGQASVSYLNASGKTIATALAGNAPANLDALDSRPAPQLVNMELLRPEQFAFNSTALALTATTTYTPSVTGPVTLSYDIEKLVSRYPGGAFQPCSSCYYELSVMVTNDCGQVMYSNSGQRTIGSSTADCNYAEPAFAPIAINFPQIESYFVTFTFRLSQKVISDYTDAYVTAGTQNGTLKKRSEFILHELGKLNFSECFSDCASARARLGSEADFTAMFSGRITELGGDASEYSAYIGGLYSAISATVSALETSCVSAPASPCDVYRRPMLLDVSPGGQYVPLGADGSLAEPAINVISLNFHNGAFAALLPANPLYQANLVTREDGSITSPYDASFTLAELVAYWKPEWADQFIAFHPEYCKLEFCEQNSNQKLWDQQLAAKTAQQAGYNYSNAVEWLLNTDPYFATGGPGAAYRNEMSLDLSQYSRRVSGEQAHAIKSLSQVVDFTIYCADPSGNLNNSPNGDTWTNCSPNPDCRLSEREWNLYQSLYLDLKEKYYDALRSGTTCASACPVGTPIAITLGNNSSPACQSRTLSSESVQLTADSYRSFNYVANSQTTYYYVAGTAGSQPSSAPYCASGSAAAQFYSCIDVVLGISTVRFTDVWEISCTENIPQSCQSSGDLFAQGSTGPDQYYINQSGYRHSYTMITGYTANSMPDFSCNSAIGTGLSFYNCFTVYYNSQVYYYTNVWVAICYTSLGSGGGGGDPCVLTPLRQGILSDNVDPSLITPCDAEALMQGFQNSGQTIETDQNSNRVYAISLTAPSAGKMSAKARKGLTQYFGGFVKKDYIAVKSAKGSYKVFRDVWVADFQSQDGSRMQRIDSIQTQRSAESAGTASRGTGTVQLLSATSPCPDTDFDAYNSYEYLTDYAAYGLRVSIVAKRANTCTGDTYVDIYRAAHGMGIEFYRSVLLPVGATYAEFSVPNETLDQGDVYFACGVLCGNPGPEVPSCATRYAGKSTRFPQADHTLPAINGLQSIQQQQNAVASAVSDNCTANAEVWMQRLEPGLAPFSSLKPALMANLIEMCRRGGDRTHPFGASSLPANATALFINGDSCRNFGDVIKATLGIQAFTNELNPWILEGAYPYDKPQQATDVYISATSPEICARLTGLRPSGMNDSQFFAFLKTTYGPAMNMDLEDFGTLLSGCGNCRYLLKSDILLPVFLQNSGGCMSRAQYNTYLADFNSAFASAPQPGWSNYEIILANYFNYKTGFALGAAQYRTFGADASSAQLCNRPPFADAPADPYACIKSLIDMGYNAGDREYTAYISEERRKFVDAYISTCSAAKAMVRLEAEQQLYHYTLYYYDLAGNLVRTVPPEGVALLSDSEIALVGENREGLALDDCNYNGPAAASDENTALQSLSNVLQSSGNSALEFWMYAGASGARQFIAATPDMKYMMQVCQNGNLLNVDIFSLSQTGADQVSLVLSNHVTADVSSLLPLQPWTHVVVQGTDLAHGILQLWVNGTQYPAVNGAPGAGCPWAITSSPLAMPRSFGMLKQLRIYPGRLMGAGEIAYNAASKCMGAQLSPEPLWYRFNVPPAGSATTIAENTSTETQFNGIYPAHTLVTSYAYNATNQVVQQQTPDAGISRFWYDYKSRLVASRNAKQEIEGDYSYTTYDVLGRIVEVGRKHGALGLGDAGYLDDADVNTFRSSGTNNEVTQTQYDNVASGIDVPSLLVQANLRKRVSASIYRETGSGNIVNASYYSYDLGGNVKKLYQQVQGLGLKTLDYEYDLVSGKVNFLAYQHGAADQFYYQYDYDAENRLIKAWSAVQANVSPYGLGSTLTAPDRRQDASYQYYLHGPLARTVLGRETYEVQGMDYAYTLQGWLKGMNGSALNADSGGDGSQVGKDALAFSLGYYTGDYSPVGGGQAFGLAYQASNANSGGRNLYNGNIASSTYAVSKIGNGAAVGYTYGYDQLNRIRNFRQQGLGTAGNWSFDGASEAFREEFAYDANGNIRTLKRKNQNGALMDNLSYGYNLDASGRLADNRLASVSDAAGVTNGTDLGNGNYSYDAIGNLISENENGTATNIGWSVYGKIRTITGNVNLAYSYDAMGNRVRKTAGSLDTYYVRDAQGNTLAVYEQTGGVTRWKEQQLYGSSHLGMWKPDVNLASANGGSVWNSWGLKFFELGNHLGNVMAVVNDNPQQNGGMFEPTVVNASDYYAFGGQMQGRNYTNPGASAYRYGFNGKENDNDVKGEGNQQDYGMRIYDPRLGRFLSVDPIANQYPELTPYQFASNTPIYAIDLDGLEACGNPIAHSRGLTNHNCAISLHKDATIKEQVTQIGGFGLFVGGVFLLPAAPAFIQQSIFWGTQNPVGLYNITSVTWGALSDEDMPGPGDDVGRTTRNSIKEVIDVVNKSGTPKIPMIGLKIFTKENKLEGVMKLSENSDIIFDATISKKGGELILDKIGFYVTKGQEILGAENKNALGSLPLKILGAVKEYAKKEGFETLVLKYKRALYDEAEKFTGYGENVTQVIPLNVKKK